MPFSKAMVRSCQKTKLMISCDRFVALRFFRRVSRFTLRRCQSVQVADEHGLEFQSNLNEINVPGQKVAVAAKPEDELERRFNELKNQP